MEIERYLVLSTVHLTCATAESLERWAQLPAASQPFAIFATHCGWFVATTEIRGATPREVPVEIPPILALARQQGCAFVLFDCDGPEEPDLPVHPW